MIVIGNLPYNDTTSQIRQEIKASINQKMDDRIKSNDLGIVSLLCYNEMKADYVLVLHPLLYSRELLLTGEKFHKKFKYDIFIIKK